MEFALGLRKVFQTINELAVGCLAALFVLYWLLN